MDPRSRYVMDELCRTYCMNTIFIRNWSSADPENPWNPEYTYSESNSSPLSSSDSPIDTMPRLVGPATYTAATRQQIQVSTEIAMDLNDKQLDKHMLRAAEVEPR